MRAKKLKEVHSTTENLLCDLERSCFDTNGDKIESKVICYYEASKRLLEGGYDTIDHTCRASSYLKYFKKKK